MCLSFALPSLCTCNVVAVNLCSSFGSRGFGSTACFCKHLWGLPTATCSGFHPVGLHACPWSWKKLWIQVIEHCKDLAAFLDTFYYEFLEIRLWPWVCDCFCLCAWLLDWAFLKIWLTLAQGSQVQALALQVPVGGCPKPYPVQGCTPVLANIRSWCHKACSSKVFKHFQM